MGLADELGYAYRRPNALRRGMQAFAATSGGAWFFSKTLAPTDRLVGRLSKGRVTVPEVMAGLPVLEVTTTGRKSGQRRATHLIAVPFEETVALLGTNFGQRSTPGWVFNLEADPRATATYRGVSREVVARPATDDERADVIARSTNFYGGYAKYYERITGRRVRIFVLEPAPAEAS